MNANIFDLLTQVTNYLQDNTLKLVTVESCTGGLLASLLTELPGSSAWFDRGFVVYNNVAKQELLGLNPQLLKEHDAVSAEAAEAMAQNALVCSHADIAVAITGIAGPDGGSLANPVGTVWLAIAKKDFTVKSLHLYFANKSRTEIRFLACEVALANLLNCVEF